jgi:tetratricopeptide (TPR) repeat protein
MPSLNRAALLKHAELCLKKQAFVQLQGICSELIRANKGDPEAHYLLGRSCVVRARHEEAVMHFKRCLSTHPRELKFIVSLASTYSARGKHDLAMQYFEKARKLNPAEVRTLAGYIEACEKAGDLERANKMLEPLLDRCAVDPMLGRVYAVTAMSDKRPQDAVNMILRNGQSGPIPLSSLYLLGKAFEKLKDADKAFEAYRMANAAEPVPFDLEEYLGRMDRIMAVFNAENLAKLPRASTRSELAVFVAGRPRSGTTLISKIIGAHPQAVDVGELTTLNEIEEDFGFSFGSSTPYPEAVLDLEPEDVNVLSQRYLDDITRLAGPKALRIVDKSLFTHYYVGLIELLLPKARIIYVRRNAVDNCLACFTEQLVGSYTFATDLRALGLTHHLHDRLMRYWRTVVNIPILEVNYEDVVDDQEGMSRKMIEFLGLPWDDACLRFYEAEQGKSRSTAALTYSYDQVRKPIYRTSVGRAAMFEKHLGPLHEALAEGEQRWGTDFT